MKNAGYPGLEMSALLVFVRAMRLLKMCTVLLNECNLHIPQRHAYWRPINVLLLILVLCVFGRSHICGGRHRWYCRCRAKCLRLIVNGLKAKRFNDFGYTAAKIQFIHQQEKNMQNWDIHVQLYCQQKVCTHIRRCLRLVIVHCLMNLGCGGIWSRLKCMTPPSVWNARKSTAFSSPSNSS